MEGADLEKKVTLIPSPASAPTYVGAKNKCKELKNFAVCDEIR
jgi:hypothetical protein